MSKLLVAYFSATGKTAKVARELAEILGADITEIVPEQPYTKADLNWMNKKSRSSLEMKDKTSRPAIKKDSTLDISSYDIIYLGAPIWWYVFPTIVNTFLESYDFGGKRIVLFATSGSSGIGNSAEELRVSAPGAEIISGEVIRRKGKVKDYIEKYSEQKIKE